LSVSSAGVDVALQHRLAGRFVGRLRDLVGDQVAEARLVLATDRRFERDGPLRRLDDLVDLFRLDAHRLGDLFRTRLAAEFLGETVSVLR
jgi:hypothetical protein